MTYDTMTDAEVDAAVAKRLGWKEVAKDWWEKPCETLPNAWYGRMMLPRYSTDIAAAMGLVEEAFYFCLEWYDGDWWAELEIESESERVYAGRCQTPARAICEAWLMAMDAKEAKP